MRTQTVTIKITYDESLDAPPETWDDWAERLHLEQDGESVVLIAAGKDEASAAD